MSDDEDCDERDYLLQDSDDVTFIRPKRNQAMGFFDSLKYVFCCRSCCFGRRCCPKSEAKTRMIKIGESPGLKFPPNVIRNQKYNVFTFLPLVLYEQFKFFLNFYFLVMAMSQLIPCLVVGSLYTYWGPLGFVVTATIVREAIDDLRRWKRDKEVNGQKYSRVKKRPDGVVVTEQIPSSEISVGDLIYIEKDQRVPADLVLLRTTDKTGSCFVRTDQLDGETDWKCRVAIPPTQMIESDAVLIQRGFSIFVEKPDKDIHSFIGNFIVDDRPMGLSIQYTLWANTVLAAGTALGLVVYTGKETRSCMNNSQPRSKNGLLDQEINTLTKVLFVAVIGLALIMMCLKGFNGPLYGGVYMFRFVLLFSYIIPLSLRVNLEFAKMFYSWQMSHDQDMPGFVVRCTTIPEELGRISYLLSDKTGTLTKNLMNFKKLSMGVDKKYTVDDESVENELRDHFGSTSTDPVITVKGQHTLAEAVLALAICHNVTPVFEVEDVESVRHPLQWQCSVDSEYFASKKSSGVSYQASSPDEIALVSWADSVGLALIKRDRHMMQLRTPQNDVISYTILQLFPFTSESKRMGIIVRNDETNEITFFMKGADMVMREIVRRQNWLDEVVNTMAEEGLRTLVVAQKSLTLEEYNDFEAKYQAAGAVTSSRELAMAAALADLEKNMDLLCVTGVEDELQDLVKQTLEVLRAAGIKIWMLTGDKLETAVCIAKSSNLVDRINKDSIFVFNEVTSTEDEQRTEVNTLINEASNRPKSVLVITGTTMEKCLKYYKSEFMEILCAASSVVVCRCSPTQKSQVVELIRKYTNKRTAAIGDGGNDVSMIQAADVGIGIAGKEGKQASLAADFSISEFSSLQRLFFIHGRWSYRRSAMLSQFIIHRGLIISVMQAIFSTIFYFSSTSIFPGFFMVGYATIYTMFPVFSLVLDKDFKEDSLALNFPNLYAELSRKRYLSFKTFFEWVLVSIMQGAAIMYGSFLLFQDEYIHIVAIAFTALILTELIMVALTVTVWHYLIVVAELVSLALYFITLFVLRDYFDPQFLGTWNFVWKVLSITLISCLPLTVLKLVMRRLNPSTYSKIS